MERAQKKHSYPCMSGSVSPNSEMTSEGMHQPAIRMPPVGHTSSPSHVVSANCHTNVSDGHNNQNPYVLEPSIIVHATTKHFQSPIKSSLKAVPMQGDNSRNRIRIETEFPADMTSPKVMHHGLESRGRGSQPTPRVAVLNAAGDASRGASLSTKQDDIIRALNALTGKAQSFQNNICSSSRTNPAVKSDDVSPAQELLGLSDAFQEKFTIHERDGLPRIQNNLYDDSDSDDSYGASQPASKDFSATSTISLNELLDQGLEDVETPVDDSFSIDDFHCGDTDEERADVADHHSDGGPVFGALIKAGQAVMASSSEGGMSESEPSKKSSSCQTSPGLEHAICECEPDDGMNNQDEVTEKAFDRKEVILNNHNSIVLCKPPLPRPLTRPNSLDLPVSTPRGHQRSEPRSCVEYSSSDSGSDLDAENEENRMIGSASQVNVKTNSKTEADIHSDKMPAEHSAKPGKSTKLCDFSHLLAVGHPVKDHGDYVLLKTPGKLAKLTNQDSGVSEPQDGGQGTATGVNLAPADGAMKHVSIEGSPETVANQGVVRQHVSSSPDSAMQQSFSSSSSGSDTVLGDKPSFRDDGYSSNSAVSFADGHASKSNTNESLVESQKRTELVREDSGIKSISSLPGGDSSHNFNDKQRIHSKEPTVLMIGKVDGFNPLTNTDYEKSSVWTREGICQEMKETYQRRSSLGCITSSVSDAKMKGLVSEMKTKFERKFADKSQKDDHSFSHDRRYSLPNNRHDEGEYVCIDPHYQSMAHVMLEKGLPTVNNNKELPSFVSIPSKPSRPKMGIHAKTRSLMASQRSRSLPRTMMSTYPSDPCLSRKSPSPSPKTNGSTGQVSRLKRTTSDSCLAQHANNRVNPVQDTACQLSGSISKGSFADGRILPKDKVNKKEKTLPVSVPKLSKSLTSKDKAQCIVGYVISEPAIPEYQFDVKMPRVEPGYLRSHSDPQKVYLRSHSDPNKAFIRSQSAPEKDVRVTGEGSEYGYKSGEDPIVSTREMIVCGNKHRSLLSFCLLFVVKNNGRTVLY